MHRCVHKWDKDGRGITFSAYGDAILDCTENEKGEFWVDNGEYSSRVNFCPYCGEKAPTQHEELRETPS